MTKLKIHKTSIEDRVGLGIPYVINTGEIKKRIGTKFGMSFFQDTSRFQVDNMSPSDITIDLESNADAILDLSAPCKFDGYEYTITRMIQEKMEHYIWNKFDLTSEDIDDIEKNWYVQGDN